MLTPDQLVWLARVVLGATFLLAGAGKLRDLAEFARGVRDYGLVPDRLVQPLAHALPVVEVTVGIALIAGIALRRTDPAHQ